jgi:hypothetical protein
MKQATSIPKQPRRYRTTVLLGAAVMSSALCAGCNTARTPSHVLSQSSALQPISSQEGQDIVERVVRNYAANTSANLGGSVIIFLSLGQDGVDPTEALLGRLDIPGVSIRPASQADKVSGRLVDRESGRSGVLLTVHGIHAVSNEEVTVMCSRFDPRTMDNTAHAFQYHLRKQNGEWIVL